MRRTVLRYIIAYLAWVVVLGLGLWFALISRQGFLNTLAIFSIGSYQVSMEARFYDKVVVVLLGLYWLVCSIVVEAYFRAGIEQQDLIRRIAKVIGAELFLIFSADLILHLQHGLEAWSSSGLLLVSELTSSLVLLFVSRKLGWEARMRRGHPRL